MKSKSKLFVIISVAMILLLCACSAAQHGKSFEPTGFVPAFYVRGDVKTELRIDSEWTSSYSWGTCVSEGVSLACLEMRDVVSAAEPRAGRYDLLLVGSDGLSSLISGDDLNGCHIAFSEQYAFECINDNHPISSNVKMLSEIIVVTREGDADAGAVGFVGREGEKSYTAGHLRLHGYKLSLRFQGKSGLNGSSTAVYTSHKTLPLRDLLSDAIVGDQMLVVQSDGKMFSRIYDGNDEVEILGTEIAYDGCGIAGIMLDPPLATIGDVKADTIYLLSQGNRVMIIELDGFGYEMYIRADLKFLGGKEQTKALAQYPPISPVGLAGMISGVTPDVHGIHDRKQREPKAKDLFTIAAELGKTSVYIEGNSALIKTGIEPILSIDANGNTTDDEVFENALEALATKPELAFIHFHGIDDDATKYGPYARKTVERMQYVDSLVEQLAQSFEGKIIITADHGLHTVPDGGAHGIFCREDMIVPYFIFDGGNISG